MKAYIICFISACIFSLIAEKNLSKGKTKNGIFFLSCSLIVISIIAGVRDTNVGIDIKVYTLPIFNKFVNNTISILEVANIYSVEILFAALMFFSSLTKEFSVALFLIEFFTALPIFIFAYKKRNSFSITFIIAIFLLTMYSKSFNLMRQSLAIAWIIGSIPYFEEKKYFKVALLFAIAFGFHYTAIVALLIYFVIYICKCSPKNRILYLVGTVVGLIFFVYFLEIFVQLLPGKYANYLNRLYETNPLTLMRILKKLFWIILSALYLIFSKRTKNERYFYVITAFYLFVIDFVLSFASVKIGPIGRLSYYFLYTGYFFFVPNFKYMFKEKYMANIMIITVLALFWYNMTVVNFKSDKTYPYTSSKVEFLN